MPLVVQKSFSPKGLPVAPTARLASTPPLPFLLAVLSSSLFAREHLIRKPRLRLSRGARHGTVLERAEATLWRFVPRPRRCRRAAAKASRMPDASHSEAVARPPRFRGARGWAERPLLRPYTRAPRPFYGQSHKGRISMNARAASISRRSVRVTGPGHTRRGPGPPGLCRRPRHRRIRRTTRPRRCCRGWWRRSSQSNRPRSPERW